MNEQFLLKIQTMLETSGVKTDYNKLKQLLEKDPAKIKTVMDMSATKTEINKFIKEIAPELQKIFSSQGVNVGVKELESSLKSVYTTAQKEAKQASDNIIKIQKDEVSAYQENSKRKQQEINNQKKLYIDEQQAYISNSKIKEAAIQKEITLQRELYLAEEQAYKTNDKINNSAEKIKDQSLQKKISLQKELFLAEEQAHKKNESMRITSEKKIQDELKKTAKANQDAFKLDSGKIQEYNRIGSYIRNNTKLTKEQTSALKELQDASLSVSDKSGLDQIKQKFRNITSQAELMGTTGESAFSKLSKNSMQFLNFLGSATVIMSAINSLKSLVTTTIELDASLVDLQMATGATRVEAGKLLSTYIDLGQELGATGTEVASAASDYLRQGKSIAETNELIKDSIVLSKLGNIDAANATKYLTTAMKGYKVAASDVIGIVDKLSAVDLVSSTDAGGLAEGMSEVANNARLAGIEMDKLLGYLAVIGESTGEGMSSVGVGLNAIFSRMGNIKLARLKDYQNSGEDLSNVETVLRGLGIKLRDSQDSFRDFGVVLDETASKWGSFSEVQQRAAASAFAGTNHMEQFLVLMENYGSAMNYSEVATNSAGTAMEKFASYEESVEAKTKRLQASLQELATDTLNSDVIKGFLDISNVLINTVDDIGLFNIAMLSLIAVIGTKTGAFKLLTDQIVLSLVAQTGYTTATAGAALAQVGFAGAVQATTAAMKSFLLTNPLGWAILAGTVMFGVVKAYDAFNVTLEETQEKLTNQKDAYANETSNVNTLKSELDSTIKKLEDLNNIGGAVVTKDGEQEKLEAQTEELQRQLDIAKEAQRIAGLEAEKTATEALESNISSKYNVKEVRSDFTGYSLKYEKVTRDVELQRVIEDYNKLSLTYSELEKKQQSLANSNKGNSKEFKNNKKELASLNEKMIEARTYANDLAIDIQTESESLIGATTAGNNIKPVIDGVLSSYSNWLSVIDNTNNSLTEANTETNELEKSTTDFSNEILDVNKVINNYQSAIKSIESALDDVNVLSSGDIIDLMQEFSSFDWAKYGITGEKGVGNLTNALKSLAKEQYDSATAIVGINDGLKDLYNSCVSTSTAFITLTDATTALGDSSSALSDLKTQIKDFGAISLNTVNSLISKYPQLTDVLYNYLGGLASTKDVVNSLTAVYETDKLNWESLMLAKNSDNVEFTNQVGGNFETLVNQINDMYGVDISNDKSYYTQKMELLNSFLSQATSNWQQYFDTTSGKLINMDDPNLTDADRAYLSQQALKANSAVGSLNTYYSSLDFSGVDANFTKATGDFTKSKKSTPAWLEAYNTDKADLDHQLAMDEIKENEYFDSLEKLNNKVYKNHKKDFLETYRKNQEDIYKGRKSIDEDLEEQAKKKQEELIDSKFGDNEHQYAMGEKSEAAYYKKLEKLNNYYYKNNKDKQDEYQANLEKIHAYEVKLAEESVQKRFDSIDHRYAMGELSEEEYYKKLKWLNDKYYKNDKDNQDKYLDNLEKLHDHEVKLAEELYKKKIDGISKTQSAMIESYKTVISDILSEASDLDDGSDEQLSKYAEAAKVVSNESKYLKNEINKLNEMYRNGSIKQEEYTQLLDSLNDSLKDVSSSVKDLEKNMKSAINESMNDLLDDMAEAYKSQTDAINDNYEAYEKLIKAKKDSLRADKEEADYKKSIAEKNKTISDIEKRIAELNPAANDGDRNALKEIRELQEKLADAQTDLDDTQADHKIDLAEDALDQALEDYKTITDAQLESAKTVYDDKVAKLKSLYDQEKLLISEASSYMSSEFAAKLAEINKQIAETINGFNSSSGSNVSNNNGGLYDSITGAQNDLSNASGNVNSVSGVSDTNRIAIMSVLQNGTGTGTKSAINKYVAEKYGSPLSFNQMVQISKLIGVGGINKSSDVEGDGATAEKNRSNLLTALTNAKFSKGGYVDASMIKSMGEDGIALVRHGEPILTVEQGKLFKELISNLPKLNDFVKISTPNISNITTNNTSPIYKIEKLIDFTGASITSDNAVKKIESSANDFAKQFMNIVHRK